MVGLIIALEISGLKLDVFGSDGSKLSSSSSEIESKGIWICVCFIDETYVKSVTCVVVFPKMFLNYCVFS